MIISIEKFKGKKNIYCNLTKTFKMIKICENTYENQTRDVLCCIDL